MLIIRSLLPGKMLFPLLGLAVLTAFGLGYIQSQPATIILQMDEQQIELQSRERSVQSALAENGITLQAEDRVTPDRLSRVRPASRVKVAIQRAMSVSLTVDGSTHTVRTLGPTVADMLRQQGLVLGPNDRVSLSPEQVITPGAAVQVVRVIEQTRVRTIEIPYQTIRREDRTLTVGETKELQPGQPGSIELTERVTLEDGQETAVETLSEVPLSPPVDRIVAFGTVGVVSRGGVQYRYLKEFEMRATGYTAGKESNPDGNGYTYTGIKAVRGVVAVDPRVIPLGSRLYVEGYGPALAADIGGAIKGNRIDLCFTTVDEALQWGVRPVKVYLLQD